MTTIDLTKRDCVLYKGCVFASLESKVPENCEASLFAVYRNTLNFFEKIPQSERTKLVLIGPIPYWIQAIIFYTSHHFFDNLYYRDEKGSPLPPPRKV